MGGGEEAATIAAEAAAKCIAEGVAGDEGGDVIHLTIDRNPGIIVAVMAFEFGIANTTCPGRKRGLLACHHSWSQLRKRRERHPVTARIEAMCRGFKLA